ncbi:hypothetical protein [Streptomyces halobius]|uniref:Uncharacterized protein n=1 Tax=Streptomyces halobius TaxID=2879846 RepID=A0ABY4LZK5_9ACTN|nr:hypothetical protein [Streptomyces halobius]UQA90652.1 hypothetical protein K9S39_00940 [Streptomyces halobius]
MTGDALKKFLNKLSPENRARVENLPKEKQKRLCEMYAQQLAESHYGTPGGAIFRMPGETESGGRAGTPDEFVENMGTDW